MSNKKKWAARIGVGVLLYLGFAALFMTLWVKKAMPGMDTAAIIFQMKVPLEGTDWTAYYGLFRAMFLWAPLCAAASICLMWVLKMKFRYRIIIGAVLMIVTFWVGLSYIEFFRYVSSQISSTKIYENYYVDPKTADIRFPETKRNLVYIYLESMENTFADTTSGGVNEFNPIEKLTQLSMENVNFGDGKTLNGPISTIGTTWTMASVVAQNCGIPLSIPIANNAMAKYDTFLPGAYSLGQVLANAGYKQELIIGSKKNFSGFDTFLESHGDPYTIDLFEAREKGYLPSKDYYVWWGYEDQYVFEIAKQQMSELAEGGAFALTLMTMDTHRVNGYHCALCKDIYPLQYDNVLACSDRQVTELVSWIQEQPWYDNTTIVIAGDHQTMDGDYVNTLTIPDNYVRKQYYTIINSPVAPAISGARTYTTVDLFPTTLAALGCTIEGGRLGLGTNLFSEEKTLAEEKGLEWLDVELGKNSGFYKRMLYGK